MPRQLNGNRRDKRARRLELAAAAREEEGGAEAAVAAAAARNCARNGRLARAGHAVEPKDAPVATDSAGGCAVHSLHDLAEELQARAGQALRLALPSVVGEGGGRRVWQLCQ